VVSALVLATLMVPFQALLTPLFLQMAPRCCRPPQGFLLMLGSAD
jgi:ABC-type glycerol-3-phosphate transport system permease component